MSKCSICKNKGGISRDDNGFIVSIECQSCFKIMSKSAVEALNEKEAKRCMGYHFERTKHPLSVREKVFQELWAKENRRMPTLNYGHTALESLTAIYKGRFVKRIKLTDRDYKIAATVIQFLGSNGGLAFLREVEEEINKRKRK